MSSFYANKPLNISNLGATTSYLGKSKVKKVFKLSGQVGQNVSRVRWISNYPKASNVISDPRLNEYFVVGTWGAPSSYNDISLWMLNAEDPDNCQLDRIYTDKVDGEITDIIALEGERFALTTSKGNMLIYKAYHDNLTFIERQSTTPLHSLQNKDCPSTSLASNQHSIATAGEDGSIFEISISDNKVIRSLEKVDPLSIYTISWVGRNELATGNCGGQIKIWDLRADGGPVKTLNNTCSLSGYGTSHGGIFSLANHPSQSFLLLAGHQSGSIDLWDLRVTTDFEPIANLADQSGGAISEIHFHRMSPDNFLTCSQGGDVNQWYPSEDIDNMDFIQNAEYDSDVKLEFLKKGIGVKVLHSSPFPINSLNISPNNRILAGSDSGFLFCTEFQAV